MHFTSSCIKVICHPSVSKRLLSLLLQSVDALKRSDDHRSPFRRYFLWFRLQRNVYFITLSKSFCFFFDFAHIGGDSISVIQHLLVVFHLCTTKPPDSHTVLSLRPTSSAHFSGATIVAVVGLFLVVVVVVVVIDKKEVVSNIVPVDKETVVVVVTSSNANATGAAIAFVV